MVLYIIWIVLTKPSLERVIVDEYRPSHDYFVCKTTTGGTIVVWIMVGYHVCIKKRFESNHINS